MRLELKVMIVSELLKRVILAIFQDAKAQSENVRLAGFNHVKAFQGHAALFREKGRNPKFLTRFNARPGCVHSNRSVHSKASCVVFKHSCDSSVNDEFNDVHYFSRWSP